MPTTEKTTRNTTVQQVAIFFIAIMAAGMTTYYERLFQVSLPDLQGIWHLTADEASVLRTFAIGSQMLLAPIAPWFVRVFGIRQILLPAALTFITVSFIIPFLSGFLALLAAHFMMGILLGCFITVSLMYMLRFLPGKWWLVFLGIHIFRVSVTANTGVSLGAIYLEYLGWEWIYWQSTILMILYISVVFVFVPHTEPHVQLIKTGDYVGMALLSLGSTALFVAIDQGERLQWFHSGLITALFAGGVALLALFVIEEWKKPNAFAPLFPLTNRGVVLALVHLILFVMLYMGNQLLVMQFLGSIHGFKPLQTGKVLLTVIAIQVFLVPVSIWLAKRVDTRLIQGAGLVFFILAYYQGSMITQEWMPMDFIPMAICFAFGNQLTLLPVLTFSLASFGERAAGIIPYFQCIRVMGPYMTMSLFTVFIRQRTDTHMVMLMQHLTPDNMALTRFSHAAQQQGSSIMVSLAEAVRLEALVLAYQDTFAVCLAMAFISLCFLVITRPAPFSPFTPVRIGG